MDFFNPLDNFATFLASGRFEERVNSTLDVDSPIDSEHVPANSSPYGYCVIA